MPAKKKVSEKINETPVIFVLKLEEKNDGVIPNEKTNTYSEIVNTPDYTQILNITKPEEKFNKSILRPLLDSIFSEQNYSSYTACFWCCHEFEGFQFKSPISYNTYKDYFICEGNFCSPECCLSHLYSDSKVSDIQRWNRHSLMLKLYGHLYENYLISFAPPKELLRKFGGLLDIKQYREYLSGTNEIILIDLPPIRMIFPSMIVQSPLKDIKKFVSLTNDVMEKASESLRLKRNKPLQQNVQTIDMCIKHK
jgi:hypothetical protein